MNTAIKIMINVLDDEEAILIAVKNALACNSEYQVKCFSKVSEFFDSIDNTIDLVITDVRLNQGVDIIDIIHRIKEQNKNCYIIVMSGYLDVEIMKELMIEGIKYAVEKNSIDWIEDLKEAVNRLYPDLKYRAEHKDLFK